MYVTHGDTTPNSDNIMKHLKIDGELLNWEGIIDADTNLATYNIGVLSGVVTDQQPNSQSTPEARFVTGDSFIRNSAQHCTFDGTECWTVRTHAKIEAISADSGYTSGGQQMTITGHGFRSDNIQVTVDGQPCEVTSHDNESLTCITSEAAQASTDGVAQPG